MNNNLNLIERTFENVPKEILQLGSDSIEFEGFDPKKVNLLLGGKDPIFETSLSNRNYIPDMLIHAINDNRKVPETLMTIMQCCGYNTNSHEYIGAETLLQNYKYMQPPQLEKQLSKFLTNYFMTEN